MSLSMLIHLGESQRSPVESMTAEPYRNGCGFGGFVIGPPGSSRMASSRYNGADLIDRVHGKRDFERIATKT